MNNIIKNLIPRLNPQFALNLGWLLSIALVGIGLWNIWSLYQEFVRTGKDDLKIQQLSGTIIH